MSKGRHNDRTCVGTGEALSPEALAIRFVRAPDGSLVADLSEKLPGRGAWLKADRGALEAALRKRAFDRELGEGLTQTIDDHAAYIERVSALLLRRALDRLGLARKAGDVLTGADSLARARHKLMGYIHPAGISDDGVRKVLSGLEKSAQENHMVVPIAIEAFGASIGAPGVVHVGLLPGRVSASALWEWARWRAFSAPEATNLH